MQSHEKSFFFYIYGALYLPKKLRLAKGIEEFVFWGGDNADTHNAKQELIEQLMNFDIAIRAEGFFRLDRRFLATVSN